jgi:hypothetical protein
VSRGPNSFVFDHPGTRNSAPGLYVVISDIGLTNKNTNPVVLAPTIRLIGRANAPPLTESSEDDPLPVDVEKRLRSRNIVLGTHRLPVLVNIQGRGSESGYVVFFVPKFVFSEWPEFQTNYLGRPGRLWVVFVDQLTGKTYPTMLFGTAIQ